MIRVLAKKNQFAFSFFECFLFIEEDGECVWMGRKGCISERILDNERLVTEEKERKNENDNNKKDPLLFCYVFSFFWSWFFYMII